MGVLFISLCILNFAIAISGKYLTYYGFQLKIDMETYFDVYYDLLSIKISCVPYVTIALGILTIIIGWFGFCECQTKSSKFLKAYAYCLLVLLALKVGVIAVLYTNYLRNAGASFVYKLFNSLVYNVEDIISGVWIYLDELAEELRELLMYIAVVEVIALFCAIMCIPKRIKDEMKAAAPPRQAITVTVNTTGLA